MAIRKCSISLAIVSNLVISILVLGSVPQATAETVTFKSLTHVTKSEMVPIADIEGHSIFLTVREGVAVFQNGDWAWTTSTNVRDLIKGAGTGDAYSTYGFMDGSTFIVHRKGTIEGTPQGVTSAAKWTGDIIYGTGRFQGIKGTIATTAKIFPPEKGESVGKALSDGTLTYTLPGK